MSNIPVPGLTLSLKQHLSWSLATETFTKCRGLRDGGKQVKRQPESLCPVLAFHLIKVSLSLEN